MLSFLWGADSAELVSAIYSQGTIHPPGYPLYFFLGKLFTWFDFLDPYARISLLSLFFSILTVITVYKWLQLVNKRISLISISAAYIFGSYLWLIYSVVPEVFMMTAFLITLQNYFLFRFYLNGKTRDHYWFIIIFSVSLFHQYLTLGSLILYLFVLYKRKLSLKKVFAKTYPIWLGALAIGFLPYLFLYWHWDPNSLVQWEEKSPQGLLRLIFRTEYGFFSTNKLVYQDWWGKLNNLVFYLQTIWRNFTAVGCFLIVLGWTYSFRKYRKWNKFLSLAVVVYGFLLTVYLDVNIFENSSRGLMERFFLLSFPFYSIFLFFGVLAIKDYATSRILSAGVLIVLLAGGLLLIGKNIIFWQSHFTNQNLQVHAHTLLKQLPQNSILILYGDQDLFPVWYRHYILNERPDIILLSYTKITKPFYQSVLKNRFSELKIPKTQNYFFMEMIKKNLTQKRIFTNFQFNSKVFRFNQQNSLYEITAGKSQRPPKIQTAYFQQFLKQKDNSAVYPFYFDLALKERYGMVFYEAAHYYFKRNQFLFANAFYEVAARFLPLNQGVVEEYALSLNKIGNCPAAEKILENFYFQTGNKEAALLLSRLGAVCFKDRWKYLYWDRIYREGK